MEFVDYVTDEVANAIPLMEWVQGVDPAVVKKAKRRENMKTSSAALLLSFWLFLVLLNALTVGRLLLLTGLKLPH